MEEIDRIRSRTYPPAPEAQRSERPRRLRTSSFRPKGHHSSSSHAHHHARQVAKETVQSAIELKPPINFEHLLRRDKKSPDSSRRGSGTLQRQQLDGPASIDPAPKTVTAGDITKAKKQNAKRQEELRDSLKGVEEVGMSNTRRLDDTYYAILEKASMLRSTVASLQQLADESRRLHTAFEEDTAKLEKDTTKNLQSFGNFDNQEQTINELVKKLQESRGRTNELNDRLESARLRVEAYEEQENAKQSRRRTRLHILWGVLVGILLLIIAVLMAQNRRAVGRQLSTVGEHLVKLGDVADDVVAPVKSRLKPSPSEDPYLRKLFDEL